VLVGAFLQPQRQALVMRVAAGAPGAMRPQPDSERAPGHDALCAVVEYSSDAIYGSVLRQVDRRGSRDSDLVDQTAAPLLLRIQVPLAFVRLLAR